MMSDMDYAREAIAEDCVNVCDGIVTMDSDQRRRCREEIGNALKRFEERRKLEPGAGAGDPSICRRQFPDGSVPETLLECAEGWKRHYDRMLDDWNVMRQQRDSALEAEARALNTIQAMHKAAPPTPAVIEGKGQAVKEEGWYLWDREGLEGGAVYLYESSNKFAKGCRYMRCPTFPPRPAFTAPEKPEPPKWVWLRSKDYSSMKFWGYQHKPDGAWRTSAGDIWEVHQVEVIEGPQTGKPERT